MPVQFHSRCFHAALLASTAMVALSASSATAALFVPGDLMVSNSTYVGSASTVKVGRTLPSGAIATNNGSYPGVFKNAAADASFGVTSPLYLTQFSLDGTNAAPAVTAQSTINLTALTGVVTSFPSKSEGALNLSPDRTSLTLVDYLAMPNQLDVSNSNTLGIVEPGNDTANATARTIVNLSTGVSAVLLTNADPGNNGRAAVNVNGTYVLSGNAGYANGSPAGTAAAGVQSLNPGTASQTSGAYNTTQSGGFSLAATPYGNAVDPTSKTGQTYSQEDKAAKDNNYRGLAVNNTVYVIKGSGSTGVNTVYQVGAAGSLPNGGSAITILPGFPSTESFTTLQTAAYGQVLRGVAFAPLPEPASIALLSASLVGIGALRRRRPR